MLVRFLFARTETLNWSLDGVSSSALGVLDPSVADRLPDNPVRQIIDASRKNLQRRLLMISM